MMIKGAAEIIKYFSEFGIVEGVKKIGEDIKNKFFGIFEFVSGVISKVLSYLKEKVRNIPIVGKYLASDEKESKVPIETKNVSGPVAIEQQVQAPVNFKTEGLNETIKPRLETSDMFSQENPENVYAMEKETMEPQSFIKFIS